MIKLQYKGLNSAVQLSTDDEFIVAVLKDKDTELEIRKAKIIILTKSEALEMYNELKDLFESKWDKY